MDAKKHRGSARKAALDSKSRWTYRPSRFIDKKKQQSKDKCRKPIKE